MAGLHAFLLAQARAACCLFVDPDVILEPGLIGRLHAMLVEQRCGFVGSAVHGLDDGVSLCHGQSWRCQRMQRTCACRAAPIDGCVLFDTARLRAVGGFDFWPSLPPGHCGEDVLAQLRVMERFGSQARSTRPAERNDAGLSEAPGCLTGATDRKADILLRRGENAG